MADQDVMPRSINEKSSEKTPITQEQVTSNNVDGTTPTQDKAQRIQIELPKKQQNIESTESLRVGFLIVNPESTQYEPQKSEQDIESNKKDLELEHFETRSIEEPMEPWKHEGPWYTDITKRRWFISIVIGLLIVIIIIVVPVVVTHATNG
ncbi:16291_t:CDS:2 [Racocetra persica]|uniref:16291_t:CDS:1 n=1 Tax=Racocetra persica TaxID=160502 RepID=A0ACA9PIL4_9GLOM|nr:16291_t:CDS:2 [Racocetra persica]